MKGRKEKKKRKRRKMKMQKQKHQQQATKELKQSVLHVFFVGLVAHPLHNLWRAQRGSITLSHSVSADFRGTKTHPKSRNAKKTSHSHKLFRKSLWNKSGGLQKLSKEACSDELFYFGWIFFGWILLLWDFKCRRHVVETCRTTLLKRWGVAPLFKQRQQKCRK